MLPWFKRNSPHITIKRPLRSTVYQAGNASISTSGKLSARKFIAFTSEVACEEEEVKASSPGWWNSVWLHSYTITSFLVLCLSLAAGVFSIWYSNKQDHGIRLLSTDHYLWTYGPTAVLVAIVSAWRQLDYQCKSLSAWGVLQNARSPAEASVVLDHISPMQVVSLADALRFKHMPIIASILGFTLLKAITLASTALLQTQDIILANSGQTFVRTSQFDGTLFNRTEYVAETDSSLVYTAFGISAFELDSPEGLNKGVAYETFQWSDAKDRTNLTLTAQIKAVVPRFQCQPAEVSINPRAVEATANVSSLVILSPSCELAGGGDPIFVLDPNVLETTVCPSIQRRGLMQRVDCFGITSAALNFQLLVLAEIEYQQQFEGGISSAGVGSEANITSWSLSIPRVESVVCRPFYEVKDVNATYATSSPTNPVTLSNLPVREQIDIFDPQFQLNKSRLEGLSDDDLGLTFLAAMLDAADLFGEATDNEFATDYPNTMFKMMAGTASSGYASLFSDSKSQGSKLMDAADEVFKSVTSQAISKSLRRPSNTNLTGETTFLETRLVVSDLIGGLMMGGFIIVATVAGVILFTRPHNVVPHAPESLLAMAEILGESRDFRDLLLADPRRKEIPALNQLENYEFTTTPFMAYKHSAVKFAIDVFCLSAPSAPASDNNLGQEIPRDEAVRWWRPLMLRKWLTGLTIMLPVLAFIGLEIVHHLPRRDEEGIRTSINPGGLSKANLLSRLIPALFMLLIATMFSAVDFNIAILAPFTAMKRKPMKLDSDLGSSLVSELPILALWQAIRAQWWSAAASASAALIGSLLTIVVSGLYTIEAVPGTQSMILPQIEILNASLPSVKLEDGSAASLASLLESANMSLPASTYNDLVFPLLGTSYSNISDKLSANATISATLPALQASLDCSYLPPSSYNITSSFNARILTASVSVSIRTNLPPTCPFGGPFGNETFLEFDQSFSLPQNSSYVGKLLDLHVGPYDPVLDSSAGETNPNQPDNPPGCPSVALIYGYTDLAVPDSTAVNVLICDQKIRQVEATTVMTREQKILNATILSLPPDTDTNTKYLSAIPSSPESNITSFPFRPQIPLDASLSMFNQTIYPSAANSQSPVDNFFQAVLFGKSGLYPNRYDALAGTSDAARNIVQDAIQKFWGRYMAQAMSLSMRQRQLPSPGGTESAALPAWNVTLTNNTPSYLLIQHDLSKITLQVMLLVMAALLAFAMVELERTRGLDVVMDNPCSIWGRMGVVGCLAERIAREGREERGGWVEGERMVGQRGSEGGMWRRRQKGSGRSRTTRFEGRMVKLGWWEDEKGKRRWGVDLVDDVDGKRSNSTAGLIGRAI